MNYTRKRWQDGEVITSDKLNNMEAGISEALNKSQTAAAVKTVNNKSPDENGNIDLEKEIKAIVDAKIVAGTAAVADGDASPYPEGTLYVVIERGDTDG